jgi:alpha-galactosidase
VIHVARDLAGFLGVPIDALAYTAVGMNHLTWFTVVGTGTEDLMPRLRAEARARCGAGQSTEGVGQCFAEAGNAADGAPRRENPFCWELLELLGAFPAPGDRHVCEFFPHMFKRERAYYGKTLGRDVYSFEDTIRWGDKGYAHMQELGLSRQPLAADYLRQIGGEHEQVIEIIDSIRSHKCRVYSANLPNQGQVPNLPAQAILEAPAIAGAQGIRAIAQPALPAAVAGTLATRLAWVETVVEAALEGSRAKFVQALLLDGSVDSIPAAEALADDLLAAQAEYLPQFAATPAAVGA